MIKRILLVWFAANFLIAGTFALPSGGWYLRLPTWEAMVAELGLIILFPLGLSKKKVLPTEYRHIWGVMAGAHTVRRKRALPLRVSLAFLDF